MSVCCLAIDLFSISNAFIAQVKSLFSYYHPGPLYAFKVFTAYGQELSYVCTLSRLGALRKKVCTLRSVNDVTEGSTQEAHICAS
jgi:hypothetical protein